MNWDEYLSDVPVTTRLHANYDAYTNTIMLETETGKVPTREQFELFVQRCREFYTVTESNFVKGWNKNSKDKPLYDCLYTHEKNNGSIHSKRQGKTCYIYVIKSDKYYKIGMSFNPKKRLSEIQSGIPDSLSIILTMKCDTRKEAKERESWLHNFYSSKRLVGEWFALDEHDIEFVLSMPKSKKWND